MLKKIAGFMLVVGLLALMLAQTTEAAPPLGGPGNENERTVKVLRTTNKAQINHYVCEALEFKNVNPYNVVNFFWAVVSREEGGIYSFCDTDEKGEYKDNGFIVVICPEYQLESLRQLAKDLDKKGQDSGLGSTYTYYRMKHRNSSDPNLGQVALWTIGASGVLVPDIETNSLLIFDAAGGAKVCEDSLMQLVDKPLRQVEMGVKVYEVDVNRDGTLGLDFQAWKNGPGKGLFSFRYDGATISFRDVNGNVVSAKGSYENRSSGFYGDYPSAFFDFLAAKGKAQTLTDTKVLAFSGETAAMTAKDEILYHRVTDNPAALDRNVKGEILLKEPQELRQSVKVGVDLAITPTIGDESIKMVTKLQVSSIQGYDGKGVPVISGPFTLENTTSVPNGVEAYLGGVTREKQVKTTRKVPVLGSIPVLGYLFGGEISTNQKTMVVASVRPVLVKDASNVTAADKEIATEVGPQCVKMLP
jgi:type II secretory pathway component GspD/PulD (secretin)